MALDKYLEAALGCSGNYVPTERMDAFARLYSQTSTDERKALYAVCRYAYTGVGEVFDIGTAAGGSTYCLAAGVLDSSITGKTGRVHGFDLFDGFSIKTFEKRLLEEQRTFASDADFFDWQTHDVSRAVVRKQVDLIAKPSALESAPKIEIAHIDAAKNLPLWKVIIAALSPRIIPAKTIWIFQDFECINQPWQIYGLGVLLSAGEFIGSARYGTMYFRFTEEVPPQALTKLVEDDFSIDEKTANVDLVYDIIERDFQHSFRGNLLLQDLRFGTKAHCHYMENDMRGARSFVTGISSRARQHEGFRRRLAPIVA